MAAALPSAALGVLTRGAIKPAACASFPFREMHGESTATASRASSLTVDCTQSPVLPYLWSAGGLGVSATRRQPNCSERMVPPAA